MSTNELAGGDRTNLILSRRFDIQGAPAPFMASEVFPNLVLENDRPEWEWLGLGKLGIAATAQAAAPGNNSVCTLRNPTGTGLLAVTQLIQIYNDSGAAQYYGIYNLGAAAAIAYGTEQAGRQRDSRGGFAPGRLTACLTGDNISATLPTTELCWILYLPDGATYDWTIPLVLAPRSEILVAPLAQNVGCAVNWAWRERAAEESELLGAYAL